MKKIDKQRLILEDKNLLKGIFILALPVMLNNILKALHDMIDILILSKKMIASEEVITIQTSSIQFVGPVIMICQALALGMMIAGAALMSQYYGAKKAENARKVSGQLLVVCTLLGIVFTLLLYFGAPLILRLMNANDLYDASLSYLRIRSIELVGLFIFFAFQATRQAQGDTITPTFWNILSIFLNLVLTYVLVVFFNMQLVGAALATTIANLSLIPICLIQMRFNKESPLRAKDLKLDLKVVKRIITLGLPAAISQAFTSLGFAIINSIISSYSYENGLNIFRPIAIGNKINSMLLFPAMGVGTVLATFVGQNIGAGNIKRAKKAFYSSLLLSLIISIVGSLAILPFREELTLMFYNTENAIDYSAVAICVKYLFFLLCGLPLMSIFQCFIGCFQGAGRTDFALALATTRLWVFRVPVIWLLIYVYDVGYQAVWVCMTISNFGAALLGLILYTKVDFKPRISGVKKRLAKQDIEDHFKSEVCYGEK